MPGCLGFFCFCFLFLFLIITSPNSLFSLTALSNSKGEFLLNGDFVVSMSKREVRVGSAVIEYSGSDNVVERLNCTDRIEEELLLQVMLGCWAWLSPLGTAGPRTSLQSLHTLQVLSVGKLFNPDVRYSFNIPIDDKPQQFYWNSHGPWQACSKPCQGICPRVSAFRGLRAPG